MPTTVVSTIGTGGDYSTLALWIAGCPANLVTSDQIWQGQVKNQAFTSATNLLAITGITTDSTRYVELTTEAGASFRDNGSVQSNALRWNSSNGASIDLSGSYTEAITCSVGFTRISKLQIRGSGSNASASIATSQPMQIDFCILEGKATNGALQLNGNGTNILRNTLVVQRYASANRVVDTAITAQFTNVTIVVPSDVTAATDGIRVQYGSSAVIKNCAIFGCTNVGNQLPGGTRPPGGTTFTTCYTDVASPPTGCTTVAYNTSTGSGFENISDATRDYRIKSTSAMLDVGTTDSTNAGIDIAGTARPSGSAYDIGAWEYVAAGGGGGETLMGAQCL
jgi:hypothetical protein